MGGKNKLGSILNEKVNGTLVRSRFTAIRMFFFNLERKTGQEKLMFCLKDTNGHDTSDPVVIRGILILDYMPLKIQTNNAEMNCC